MAEPGTLARLGVLGGTFDPIHFGHLRIAEEAIDWFQLDRVLFIPSGAPPHKLGDPVSSPRDRYAMSLLATAAHPQFDTSSMELDRQGLSYTVDTLAELQGIYGSGVQIYFILGADAALEMHTWKAPERVLDLCQLVISSRPGFDLQKLSNVPVQGLAERAKIFQGPSSGISATEIRQRIRDSRSIRFLTPESVREYILKRGLYREG